MRGLCRRPRSGRLSARGSLIVAERQTKGVVSRPSSLGTWRRCYRERQQFCSLKKLYYRSPSKVALEHQRPESPSSPPTPTKLWQLVLLRLLCRSPSAAFLPRPLWRGRFCFRWPFDTRFRGTFHPPRSRLTRPRVGFRFLSVPTVSVWSHDGGVVVEIDSSLEIKRLRAVSGRQAGVT
jgi:hypothetical protein